MAICWVGLLLLLTVVQAAGVQSATPGAESIDIGIRASMQQNGLGAGQEDQLQAALYGHPGAGGQQATKPERDQFVVAIATHRPAENRILATRASRMGLRTFIATNYKPTVNSSGPVRYPEATNETWTFYPDDNPVRSYSPGDTRAALAPFLAYRHYVQQGQADFRWLFLGDDDTLFMVDAAREAVALLDADMPIFLTDNAWFSKDGTYHPHKSALRCVPCNYARNMSLLPMNMIRGCPCTPQVMCSLMHGYHGLLNPKACGPPRLPSVAYSMHGGSGALLSVGLLRKVPFDKIEQCVLSQWNSGADAHITICLWEMGVAMTDPDPLFHPEGMVMFDPTPPPYNGDENIMPKAAHFLGNLLRRSLGHCVGLCQLEHNHTVSLHLRASRIGSFETPEEQEMAAQAVLRAVSRFYALHMGAVEAGNSLAQDVGGQRQASAAAKADARLAAGRQLVKDMPGLFEAGSAVETVVSTSIDPLLSSSKAATNISIMDKARTGAATAIAKQVLEIMLKDCTETFVKQSTSRSKLVSTVRQQST